VAPLEPWEKALVDYEAYSEDVHSNFACSQCHAGQQSEDKETVHTDLISYPSEDPELCGKCHTDVKATFSDSLHASQEGYWTTINARSVPENHPELEEMFGNHCASCHTSCGDCHVSQPRSVGGGLIEGHLFKKTPSMTRNCTACHLSRVGNEFLGKNEDVLADVHFRQGRMRCTDCHTGAEMHGDVVGNDGESPPTHRYDGAQAPRCESCHENVTSDDIQMHQMHGEKLSCQVCHSVTYSSCDGCHVALSEDTGNPFFRTEGTYSTFLIGRNTRQNEQRPYDYVPVRHIPVAPTSYQYYGEDLLPNFDSLPTWAYATPHNIQRNTPQNESCEACHGNAEIFLTADKVAESELAANFAVILETVPGAAGESGSSSSRLMLPDHHAGFPICLACHLEGGGPAMPENHAEHTEAVCTSCHTLPEAVEEQSN